MKKINIRIISIIFYIIFSSSIMTGQFDPPELNFLNGLEENWKYISYDSNFVKYPYSSAASPYWSRFPYSFIIKDDNILFLELCIAQPPFVGQTGSLLHKLNYKTGELEWINYNNMYVGLDTFEDYLGGYMQVNKNGKIELMGLRSNIKIEKDNYGLLFYGSPIKRIIDFDTGELLETKIGTKLLEKRAAVNGIGFVTTKNSKGQLFRIGDRVTFPDGIIHEVLDFHLIDDNLNIIYPPYDSIVYNTNIHSHEYSLSYPVDKYVISDDTLMVSFGTANPEDAKYSPTELTLKLIYIGDKDSIHIVKSVDMVDDLYFPQYVESIRPTVINDGVVFTQRIISNEPDVPSRKFIWLSWYDRNCNRKAKIDYLSINDYYYIDHIQPLFNKDGNLYIAARRKTETNDTTYHDIIKVNPGVNDYEKLATVSIAHDPKLDIYINKSILLPDDQVILEFWINKDIGNIATNFVYFYNFNLKDLGIKTSDIELVNDMVEPEIFPNPANDFITIKYDNNYTKYLEITDQLGRIVKKKIVSGHKEQTLDISALKNGLYYIRVTGDEGKEIKTAKFIKDNM